MTAALEGGEWSAARPGRILPPENTRYPFYRRFGGPLGRPGRAETLVPTGFRSRNVQPVAQSLYRLSHPAHFLLYQTKKIPTLYADLSSSYVFCACQRTRSSSTYVRPLMYPILFQYVTSIAVPRKGLVHTFRLSTGRELTGRASAQLGTLKHLRF